MACSLKPAEWAERKRLIEEIASAGVQEVNLDGEMLTFRFRSDPKLSASLQGLIELESDCCPFLEFELEEHGGLLNLTVQAPNGPETALDALRDMFASQASRI